MHIDLIEIAPNNVVQVREVEYKMDGDVRVVEKYSRYTVSPGDDLSCHKPEVVMACEKAWAKTQD